MDSCPLCAPQSTHTNSGTVLARSLANAQRNVCPVMDTRRRCVGRSRDRSQSRRDRDHSRGPDPPIPADHPCRVPFYWRRWDSGAGVKLIFHKMEVALRVLRVLLCHPWHTKTPESQWPTPKERSRRSSTHTKELGSCSCRVHRKKVSKR